jgi:predicted PurR-regulated permease PerM
MKGLPAPPACPEQTLHAPSTPLVFARPLEAFINQREPRSDMTRERESTGAQDRDRTPRSAFSIEPEPTKRAPDRLAVLLGARLYGAIGLLFLAALMFRFFDTISRVLLIAFLGVIVAMAFNAIVTKIPLRRGIATALIAIATLGIVGGLIYLGINALIPQIRAFANDLPLIQSTVQGWEQWLQNETGMELELVGDTVEMLLADPFGLVMMVISQAFGVLEIIGLSVLILFGALFIVAKPNEMLMNPLLRAIPSERRPAARRMMSRMSERLVGWLQGTLISMVLIGVLSALAFWIAGAPYWPLLGVFVGIVEIIPIVGPWIGGAVAVLVTAFFDPQAALWVAVAVLIIQQVEGNLIRPFVMAGAAELHPFVTLLALLLFGAMFGFLGALLALPLALAVGTIIEVFWVEETIETADEDIEPMVKS